MYPDLRGKTAIVTGGSRGLGAALCVDLARHGARVVVCARDPDGVGRTVDAIRGDGGTAIGVAADCSKGDELAATFPLGRLGNPDDVTGAALFLLSDASGWITGATVDIAGGKIYS
jgi:3-oxoacyl-[acyl-carrier protein] reductase